MKSSIIFLALSLALLSRASALTACSATYCGTHGALKTCLSKGTINGPTRCYFWAATPEAKHSCDALKCTFPCYFAPVYGSDGNPYCTPCHIHQKSCQTRFRIYGPVPGHISSQTDASPVPESERAEVISHVQSVERASILPDRCSMEFCTLEGAAEMCTLDRSPRSPLVIPCGKFSFTSESKRQCKFACPQICLPEDEQPIANNGKKFCSVCILRLASCASHYRIFGPIDNDIVPLPTPVRLSFRLRKPKTECSMPFCTSNGAAAKCFDTKLINCKLWAKTPEKEEQCAFLCPLFCLPEDQQPIDNTGRKHCSSCQLQSASCGSDFAIYAA